MPFDWKTLIELARQLEQQSKGATNPEPLQRSAVNRAYIGAYGHARYYAVQFLDFAAQENADDHGRLRAHLRSRRRQADAKRLQRLRQLRNDADYLDDLPWDDVGAMVSLAVVEAEDILRSLIPPSA